MPAYLAWFNREMRLPVRPLSRSITARILGIAAGIFGIAAGFFGIAAGFFGMAAVGR